MNVFNRVEIKYLITKKEYQDLINLIESKGFFIDEYKRSTIQSLYYDTPNNELIRKSIDKPVFKEKIRLRNYGENEAKDLYLELKRKFDGTVYKRRIKTNINNVKLFFQNKYNYDSQIGKEINSFRDHYKNLKPAYLIISEREAYYSKGSDLRFTFDFDIRYRNNSISFSDSKKGIKLIDENTVLLEIKGSSSYPLWLSSHLNNNKIFKTNFSKYGNAYIKVLKENKYGKLI